MLWLLQPLVDKIKHVEDLLVAMSSLLRTLVTFYRDIVPILTEIKCKLDLLEDHQEQLQETQTAILDRLISVDRKVSLLTLPIPGPYSVRQIAEDNDMLKYSADLKPAKPNDANILKQGIKTQRFSISNADTGFQYGTQLLDISADAPADFEVPRNKNVKLDLTFLDQDENESGASTQTFFSKDTIPPDAPGAFGAVTLLAETETPDPVEESNTTTTTAPTE